MKEKYLETILVLATVLVIIFLFYENIYLLYSTILLACIGLFFPRLGKVIHRTWMKFAEKLGFVMNKVILSTVFFVFLVPVALLSKLFRKNPLKSRKKHVNSYFTTRNFTYTKKSLEDLW